MDSVPSTIRGLWDQIETWLVANAPDAVARLPAAASEDHILAAETVLGTAIPADLRALLAIHDGSAGLWLHEHGEFMSATAIASAWDCEVDLWDDGDNDEWAHPEGPIRARWFDRAWIPFVDARTGDRLCLDLAPAPGGNVGQVIAWSHTSGPTIIVAPSLAALLRTFALDLVGGKYVPDRNRVGDPFLRFRDSES